MSTPTDSTPPARGSPARFRDHALGGTAGLSAADAAARLVQDGRNVLPRAGHRSAIRSFVGQFTHLLAALLWVASAMALLAGTPALSVAIVVVIVLNAGFAFWQEQRADRSLEKLTSMLPSAARVVRDGVRQSVDTSLLVRGDLVCLEPGDRVPADLVVRGSDRLSIDESMVTGESDAVSRATGDRLLSGTYVVQGVGYAEVVATGSATALAEISSLASSATRPPSPLTRELNRVVRTVAVIAVTVGAVLGVSGLQLGLGGAEAFLFGVGVAVALIPEGLLPTITLSLAHGAQQMARCNALVRRLDAVETLGATTFICTDKTGTLTQNKMEVVEVWTRRGTIHIRGAGYEPVAASHGPLAAQNLMPGVARAAVACITGRAARRNGTWVAEGDPLEAAVWAFGMRSGVAEDSIPVTSRAPYSADRMLSSAVPGGDTQVIGAPERVFARCVSVPPEASAALDDLTARGRRVIAVAHRAGHAAGGVSAEDGLELLALLGLEDPPRPDVHRAVTACRQAGITVIMVTGDHLGTAVAIAREVGLLRDGGVAITSPLPADDDELAGLLDHPDGAVVARVLPADKLRIARVMRGRGHVVAMTGDGVNDAPALREADVGVAMGATGADVAREAADLVLLDDHFGTIVTAIRLGRATFANARRFLTYHLTDNVAELAPFAAWALSGGQFPLAIGVLQVLALDIGADMLPALALGLERPSRGVMKRKPRLRRLIDGAVLGRAFTLLGPTEATLSLSGFAAVLLTGGWTWGTAPSGALLAAASGTAFAVIASAQMANAFACRSESTPVFRLTMSGNPAVLWAVGAQTVLLLTFLGVPWASGLLGGSWPPPVGWIFVVAAPAAMVFVDWAQKRVAAVIRTHGRSTRTTGGRSATRRRRDFQP